MDGLGLRRGGERVCDDLGRGLLIEEVHEDSRRSGDFGARARSSSMAR